MAPGKGAPASIMDPQGQGPPWSESPMEVPCISVGRSPITNWGHAEWPGGGLLRLANDKYIFL